MKRIILAVLTITILAAWCPTAEACHGGRLGKAAKWLKNHAPILRRL